MGRHRSGYTSFNYDVTPYLIPGGRNELAVHVDPTRFEGWWYEGGGIYRHVWLNIAGPVHVKAWGTFVTTDLPEPKPSSAPAAATVHIATTISNDLPRNAVPVVECSLLDGEGRQVAVSRANLSVLANAEGTSRQSVLLGRPKLWSLGQPNLYTLRTTVSVGGKVWDQTATPFGVRTVRYDANSGFYLNGKHVKIQGTCNHQDFIGVGIGVPDTLEAWRVAKLKEMGSNAWRMSHNPPTPSLLDACDREGMLVMDENRELGDSPDNLKDLGDMVQRDRNHPSVIMWSMCNEEPAAGTARGGEIIRAMMATVHRFDTTRKISSAMNSGWFGHGFTDAEDLMGVNYNTEVYDKFHAEHPNMPIFASETASTVTTRGEYADNREKTYVSSYNMTDDSWSTVGERPFMIGSFVWTGFDYKGEPSPYEWPCINSHFGIMDMCGFPKDNYYYYTSWWKSTPSLHLMPDWNMPGKEGQEVTVIAFSNAKKVRLSVNGADQGTREVPRLGHAEWKVKYAPGELSAIGYDASGNVVSSAQVWTTLKPSQLKLTTERLGIAADGEDLTVVKVEVLDQIGHVVPYADDLVSFSVRGPAKVLGVGNGNPSDHDPDKGSSRHAFHGLCAVLVGGATRRGPIEVVASSPELRSATLLLDAR